MLYLPLISIIIPVYNAEKYLEECLTSVQNQDYKNFEAIIIDDGSTDSSAEICKKFVETDSRFRYFYQNNAGVSSARNTALKMAEGEFFGFIDSDDFIKPDMYTSLYRILSESNADVAITSSTLVIDGVVENKTDSSEIEVFGSKESILEMYDCKRFAGHMWSKLIKRELFEGIEFPTDISICEDMLVCWEVFLRSKRVVFCDNHKYFYRIHSASALNCTFKESFLTYIVAAKRMRELMVRNFPDCIVYADCFVLQSYIDTVDRLCNAGLLDCKTSKEYRNKMREYANSGAIKRCWWHQRFSIRTFLLGYPMYMTYRALFKTARGIFRFLRGIFTKKK